MLTGDEYRESLRDGRATFFEGEVVDDLPNHPILGTCVDVVAPHLRQVLRARTGGAQPADGRAALGTRSCGTGFRCCTKRA